MLTFYSRYIMPPGVPPALPLGGQSVSAAEVNQRIEDSNDANTSRPTLIVPPGAPLPPPNPNPGIIEPVMTAAQLRYNGRVLRNRTILC